jgi:hypothetical protein
MRLSLETPPDSALPAAAGLALHDSSRWLWIAGVNGQVAVPTGGQVKVPTPRVD